MSKKVIKTKDRELTEARLLEAAEKVFSKVGYSAATTRQIAVEAETNIALISRYFSGKYGLLIALIEKKNKEFKGHRYEIQACLEDELHAFAMIIFDRMASDIQFFKIVVSQFLTDAKFLKQFRDIINDFEDEDLVRNHFHQYIKKGNFKNEAHLKVVLNGIRTQSFGTIITEYIVRENKISVVKENFSQFIRIFAQGFTK